MSQQAKQQQAATPQAPSAGQPHPGSGADASNADRKPALPSLFVSNLPEQGVYSLTLEKHFQSLGYKVKTAKVIVDSNTMKNRGFGYIYFDNDEELERCYREQNNSVYQGKPLILSRSGENQMRNPQANIIVRNIPKHVSQQQIFQAFSEYGQIMTAKLVTYPDGTSRGFAYIQYTQPEQAQKATAQMNKQNFFGQQIEIDLHKRKEERDPTQQQVVTFSNLFIKGLDDQTGKDELQQMFSKFGEILQCDVKVDDSGKRTGIGYVNFKNPEDAVKARSDMNGKEVKPGMHLMVDRFINRQDNQMHKEGLTPIAQSMKRQFENNLFVNFIPAEVSEADVRKVFESVGKIKTLRLKTSFKQSFQTATILYEDIQSAQKAIQSFHQDSVFGGWKPISVDWWVSKEEQRQDQKQKNIEEVSRLMRNLMSQANYKHTRQSNPSQNYQHNAEGNQRPQHYNQQHNRPSNNSNMPNQQSYHSYNNHKQHSSQNHSESHDGQHQQERRQGGYNKYNKQHDGNRQGGYNQNRQGGGNRNRGGGYQGNNRQHQQREPHVGQHQQNPMPPVPTMVPVAVPQPMPPVPQEPLLHFQRPPLSPMDIDACLSSSDDERRQRIGDIVYNAIIGVVHEKIANMPPGLNANDIACKITAIVIDAPRIDFRQFLSDQSYFDHQLSRAFNFTIQNMMPAAVAQKQQPMPGQ